MVRRRWKEEGSTKGYCNEYDLTIPGMKTTPEFRDFLKEIGVQCFKIASGDFTDLPLIRHVAKMNVPMIISTGVANMEEVEEVVNLCMFESNKKLHCYTALRIIQQTQRKLIC